MYSLSLYFIKEEEFFAVGGLFPKKEKLLVWMYWKLGIAKVMEHCFVEEDAGLVAVPRAYFGVLSWASR